MKDLETDVQCPNCNQSVRLKVKEMVPGRTKPCPYCRAEFRFSGDDGRQVQRELDDLERSIKKLSRTINIKL